MARVEIPEVVAVKSGSYLAPVAGARVQVNVTGAGAATVYAAATGSTPLTNPLVTGASGQVEGWLEPGTYDLVVSGTEAQTGIPGGISGYTKTIQAFDAAAANTGLDTRVSALETTMPTKAPLASPALTGSPTAPTPSAGDKSTKIATTATVNSVPINTRPTSETADTATRADRGGVVNHPNTSTATHSVPAATFAAGDFYEVLRSGAGTLNIAAGAGMTLRVGGSAPPVAISTQFTSRRIFFLSASEAVVE